MRAYSRRHRRWRNRYSQPLMLVTDEPLTLGAIAAIGRALFRYRSELAPFTTAIGLATGGLVLHHAHRGSWP